MSGVLFVVGAFLALLSRQTVFASIDGLEHQHLPPCFRVVTSIVGNFVIVGIGVAVGSRMM